MKNAPSASEILRENPRRPASTLTHLQHSARLAVVLGLLAAAMALLGPTPARADETWHVGAAFADATSGSLTGSNFFLGAHLQSPDYFCAFHPANAKKKIRSLSVLICARRGSYDATFTLTFEVRQLDGTFVRTVSAEPVDLKTAPVHGWVSVPLAKIAGGQTIAANEYLAVHVVRGGAAGGNLEIFPLFEAVVR